MRNLGLCNTRVPSRCVAPPPRALPSAPQLWQRAVSFGQALAGHRFGTGVQVETEQGTTTVDTVDAPQAGPLSATSPSRSPSEDDRDSAAAVRASSSGVSPSSPSSASSPPSAPFSSSPSASSSPRSGRGQLRLEVRVIDSISKVSREEWDAVAGSCIPGGEVNPVLLWDFIHAMEESGSACPRTGWLPQHIVVRELASDEEGQGQEGGSNADRERVGDRAASSSTADSGGGRSSTSVGRLVGCVPMYLKGHSYGEYVFDSSWADFAARLGMRYYPKLQAAVPFTPITGPRLLVSGALPQADRLAVVRALGRALIGMADSMDISGVHLTFNTAQEWAVLAELGFKQRLGIQFHWENPGYASFDAFLADLKQSKRKSIRQERKSIEKAGLTVHRLSGSALTAAHWDRFYSFYCSTVDRKWGNAYLTRDFFQQLGSEMPEQVLLVAATDAAAAPSSPAGAPPPAQSMVAAALNLVGSHALFGRNWGAEDGRDVKNLHFELCYYQALDEAIVRGMPRVEAGAQGEHKLQRGYLPSFTYSCHYIRDPMLSSAVDSFLSRERRQIEYSLQVMSVTASPYKKERTVEALMRKVQAYNSLSSSSSSSSSSSVDIEDLEQDAGDGSSSSSGGSGGDGGGV